MSTNQVLNVTDEIIDGNAKYFVTDNEDNTKNISLANRIIEQATELNKNLFDKIDNVLSYLTPSVEKMAYKEHEDYEGNIIPIDISPTWNTSNQNLGTTTVTQNMTTFNDITPIIKYSANNNFYVRTSTASSYRAGIDAVIGYSETYNSNGFIENSQRTSFLSDAYYNYIGDLNTPPYIIIDMKYACKIRIHARFDVNANLYGSNDGIEFTNLAILESSNSYTYESEQIYRYYKLDTGSSSIKIYYCYIDKVTYNNVYRNQFTLDNNASFTNNQRVLVETPKTKNEYVISQLYGVSNELENQIANTTYIGSTNINFSDGTQALVEYNIAGVGIAGNYTKEQLNNALNPNIIKPSFSADNSIRLNETENYIIFDLLRERHTTLCYGPVSTIKISVSNDKVSWEELSLAYSYGIINKISLNYRYIKIHNTYAVYIYLENVEDYNNQPYIDLDGVVSNTINNVPCDTLLLPKTKYELIYNESDNKFELGGTNNILLDIILEESVSLIDISNIHFSPKKEYYIYFIGGFNSEYTTYLRLSSNKIGNCELIVATSFSNLAERSEVEFLDEKTLFIEYVYSSDYRTKIRTYGEDVTKDNMYITSSYPISIGTRIIIEEVA